MHGLNTKNIGNKGENIACEYLKKQGYKIIARNLYIGKSELDIIAKDGENRAYKRRILAKLSKTCKK